MAQIIGSPSKYIQGNGEITRLYNYVSGISKKGAFAIVDGFVFENYTDDINRSFEGENLPLTLARFNGECSKNEIDRLKKEMEKNDVDVVLGIGGGKTLDTAKAVAFYAGVPAIICPTLASTDAPTSALSVVYTDDGQFEEYLMLPQNPALVIVDTAIVAKAPARFLVAGIGDALATYFESRAAVKSGATHMQNGLATNAAFVLSERCYEILLEDGYKAKVAVEQGLVTKAVENIIEANTYLSGIGFESCGLAAAHAVHNALTALEETHHFAHGEKVAFGTLVQLVLENAVEEEIDTVIDLCQQLGLPTCLADLGVTAPDAKRLMEVAELACADGDTMGNMPFPVVPADVYAAILVADKLGAH